jgi:predicted ATPase
MTTLIGRNELLGALHPRLAADRLVTLVGPGGVGKTRLAVAAARDSTLDTWFVDLTRLDTAASVDDLAELVLTVLDLRDSTARTPLDRLADALRPRALLLLLDNCEHVIDAAAELAAALLADGTAVRVLATSREPLNLPGETIWDVPPLSVPDREPVLADLPDVPSVRLFVERAAAGSRGFALTEENARQVATLCRRLDGIPLALELAAGRVRALGVTGLVSRLDDRLRLLASAHRGTPPRQQTLHSVIDWSWNLLTGEEQRFLRRMSVPVGGFTPETASAVAGTPALDLLAQLVDRSLVVMEETADGPRFRLLESVSAYCAERLEEAGETALVRDRHLDHFLSLAESAAHALYGHTDPAALRALDAESANFHAAFDHAAGSRALRLANALTWYRFLRGRLTEARRALGAALADPALPHDAARATAVTWEAVLAVLQGDMAGWDAHRDRALSAWTGLDRAPERATALWLLAYAGVDTGDLAGTEKLLDGALAGARAAADPWGEAAALVVKAKVHHVSGELEALERCATEAAVLFGDDPWGRLQANEWLGALAEMTGDHDRALALTLEGLDLARELRLWPEVAGRLAWHAWISLQLERFEEARESAAEALRLAEEQDHHGTLTLAGICLAFAARRTGDLTAAEHHLGRLLAAIPASESTPLHQPMVLCELGYVAELRGDPERALDLHFNAYEVGRSITATRDFAGIIEGMAAALTALSRPADAARLLGTAGRTRREAGLPASPAERLDLARTVAAARAALGEAAYETAIIEGESLSFEAAVQLAVQARQAVQAKQ